MSNNKVMMYMESVVQMAANGTAHAAKLTSSLSEIKCNNLIIFIPNFVPTV